MGIATKQQCLLLPTAACGGAGPDPQHVLHPLSAGIFFFFSPWGGWGSPQTQGKSPPLAASKRQVWLLGPSQGFAGVPTSAGWDAGARRDSGLQESCWGGAWQPPNVGKGPGATRGAARELAGPQQPSSRGGGGVVITHSLQPNQPSFVANSSPQARMGFILLPPPPNFFKMQLFPSKSG